MKKNMRVSEESYSLLTGFMGRVMKLRGERVYYSEALMLAVKLADTHSDKELEKTEALRGES